VQEMYGANYNYQSGDTTYSFSTTTGEMYINGISQGTPGGNRIFRTIWDGNGNDTYDFSNYTNDIKVNLQPGKWTDLSVGGNFQRAQLGFGGQYARAHVFNAFQVDGDTRSRIENANGGSGDDTLYGNSADNLLQGNGGNDTIHGYAGNDTLKGGDDDDYLNGDSNNDILYGNDGNDTLLGSSGNDILYGGNHNDTVNGGSGNDFIDGGWGLDSMDGGAGTDVLDVRFWDDAYELNMETGATNYIGEVAKNFEYVLTGSGNDIITGTGGDNFISTGDGADKVLAGDGKDTIFGGLGNDWIDGGFGVDTMDGGSGFDTLDVRFWYGAYELDMKTGVTNYAGETATNFEQVYTGIGNDKIRGTSGFDVIDTGGGHDLLEGREGNDILEGGSGNDTLDGGALEDYNEIDYVTGGSGADIFSLQDDGDVYKGLTVILDFNFFEGDKLSLPGSGASAFNGKFDFQAGTFGTFSGAYLVRTTPGAMGNEVAFLPYNSMAGIGTANAMDGLFGSIASPIV
ncbi:MAG: hypothetical protein F6K42_16905, partial [Leptolyngbya sp. SIO1D8]|nr:hypothetical protein [Leptolyngbya sp. SIO1D8]